MSTSVVKTMYLPIMLFQDIPFHAKLHRDGRYFIEAQIEELYQGLSPEPAIVLPQAYRYCLSLKPNTSPFLRQCSLRHEVLYETHSQPFIYYIAIAYRVMYT